jgi:predicted transcriptional regulator of viral defense system
MNDPVLLDDWLRLVRAEYEELPDLHLTHAEVERLWGLDPLTADSILTRLVTAGVLRKTSRGGYVRSNAG